MTSQQNIYIYKPSSKNKIFFDIDRKRPRKVKPRPLKEYALYHGDQFIAIGTVPELAKLQGVTDDTIRWYGSSAAKRKVEGYHIIETGTFSCQIPENSQS